MAQKIEFKSSGMHALEYVGHGVTLVGSVDFFNQLGLAFSTRSCDIPLFVGGVVLGAVGQGLVVWGDQRKNRR